MMSSLTALTMGMPSQMMRASSKMLGRSGGGVFALCSSYPPDETEAGAPLFIWVLWAPPSLAKSAFTFGMLKPGGTHSLSASS